MTDLACTKHKPVFSHTPREVYGHLIYNKIVLHRKCVINGVYAIINRVVYLPPKRQPFVLRNRGCNHYLTMQHMCVIIFSKTPEGCDHNLRNNKQPMILIWNIKNQRAWRRMFTPEFLLLNSSRPLYPTPKFLNFAPFFRFHFHVSLHSSHLSFWWVFIGDIGDKVGKYSDKQ